MEWEPSNLVEATNNINTEIFPEHVKGLGVLLGKNHHLPAVISVCRYDILQSWDKSEFNIGKRSLCWIYFWFHDLPVHRRLPILP